MTSFPKDTVFRMQFSYPDHCVDLAKYVYGYNDLTPADIRFWAPVNRQTDFYRKDDLCFSAGKKLLLFTEARDYYPVNVPPRMLLYYADVLQMYLHAENIDLSKVQDIDIFSPRFCVLCTGPSNFSPVVKISDYFTEVEDGCSLELQTRVQYTYEALNDPGCPKAVREYVQFCHIFEDARNSTVNTGHNAIIRRVEQECLRTGVLARVMADYHEYFVEALRNCWRREDWDEARREEGRMEIISRVEALARDGFPAEDIAPKLREESLINS